SEGYFHCDKPPTFGCPYRLGGPLVTPEARHSSQDLRAGLTSIVQISGILAPYSDEDDFRVHRDEVSRTANCKEPFSHMAVITGESIGLEQFGFGPVRSATRNLTAAVLFEEAIRRREGIAATAGPLVVRTGKHTGRSPQDKFFVREATSEKHVDWGKTNKPFDQEKFDALLARVDEYLREKDVFVLDAFAGADPKYRLPVRVVTEYAWHNMFARHLFIPAKGAELKGFTPEFAVVDAANFLAVP